MLSWQRTTAFYVTLSWRIFAVELMMLLQGKRVPEAGSPAYLLAV